MDTSKYTIPADIQAIVNTDRYELNDIGMSDSEVRIYDKFVLKIRPYSKENDNEFAMTKWLGKKIPIPEIPAYCISKGTAYTLSTRIEGKMLCDDSYLHQPETLIQIAADGLKQLWEVDIKDCPHNSSRLSERLKEAEYNVMNGLVDIENAEPETFGPNGFAGPEELLRWLQDNQPEEDIVFTHGDYSLPNILVSGNRINGFIDLGKMGPADRWQDVAIALRSLEHNFSGRYRDGKRIFDFKPQMLLDKLGIEFDSHKYSYYILLDELF